MSLFAKVQQAKIQTQDKDVLGGTLPTNVYKSGIKLAYMGQAESGAISVNFEFVLLVNGNERTHKETFYISNKEGSFEYTAKDGSKAPLKGYEQVDTICKATVGKSFSELAEPELKMVRIKQDEDPVQREVLMELLGKKLMLGIADETVDKTALNQNTKKYEPTGETRDQNVISKIFDEDGFTTSERATGVTEPAFMHSWVSKFAGRKFNKAKGANKGTGAVAGSPAQAGQALKLF